jgi:nucleotide-binding universal stress UspA family protein
MAAVLGTDLILLHVVDSEQMITAHADDRAMSSAHARELVDAERAEAEAQLTAAVVRIREESVTSTRFEVLEGRSVRAISRRAEGLDCPLVAMSTRRHSGLLRAVLGSVAAHVAHHAPCPVLLVGAEH